MDTFELFGRLALSFGIGLLFGIERGWKERDEGEGARTAGIRTFTLIGMLGGIWGVMTPMLGSMPLAAAGVTMGTAFTLFYWRETSARKEYSVTSVVAALVAFALGALAVLGSTAAAAAAAVAAVGVLAARQRMHEFVRKLTWLELRSGVLLLAMSFVALPVLPNRAIDPWGTFNPYELWLTTVLIAVVSFLGYTAVRWMGERRGILLSSVAGSLVSSTTVTINNSRLMRMGAKKDEGLLAEAICLAWIVSFLRMTTVACVININMLQPLAIPILSAVGVLTVAALIFQHQGGKDGKGVAQTFENPLDLSFVLRFGALLAVVAVAANLVSREFGQSGVLGLAGISGFVDVDPITLSVSRSATNTMMYREAGQAILLAAATNMVTKMSATMVLGGPRFGLKMVVAGMLALSAAGVALIANGV
jgi:uncharacterized membrane protein (DUF4010 family)